MAAERPTLTNRSRFGSSCAAAAVCLCLAHAISGCLNPLTDDQPSAAPTTASDERERPGAPAKPPTGEHQGAQFPDDLVVAEPGSSPNPSSSGPVPGSNASDAGAEGLDAGPDSGSMEPPP